MGKASPPTAEQLQIWLDGIEPAPDLEAMKAFGKEIGARRLAARAEAADYGRRLRLIIPLLWRAGDTNQAEMIKDLGTGYVTIGDALEDAGIRANRAGRKDTRQDPEAA